MPVKDIPTGYRVTCTRRQFWRALLQELFVVSGSARGGQGAALANLGSLPTAQLAQMHPKVNPDCRISTEDDNVWAQSEKTGARGKLFAATRENLLAFNRFDGQHTIGEIGRLVAAELGWTEDRAFALVRDLFLSLASRAVCVPADAPPLG